MHDEKEKEDGKAQTGVKFSCFDVYSSRQGSLRLWPMPYAVLLLVFLGLYLCIGAVLSYNQEDADQRDMITNLRMFIEGRIRAHELNFDFPFPEEVSMTGGEISTELPLTEVIKSRDILTDPRLLPLWAVLQPMVAMREMNAPIRWRYYLATLPSVAFPPFAWDASLNLDVTFKLAPEDMLPGAQILNSLPPRKRPRMAYTQTASDNDLISQVWTITATFSESMRAFKIEHDNRGSITVSRVTKVECDIRYTSVDVPATVTETDASRPQYREGRPALSLVELDNGQTVSCGEPEYFQTIPECREARFMPHIHALTAIEFEELYSGPVQGAPRALSQPLRAEVTVEVRDLYQPKPYAPLMTEFGEPFFVGFSLLLGAIITLVFWCVLRCHVVIRNVRVNEGLPPMFYQGMRRFRGW